MAPHYGAWRISSCCHLTIRWVTVFVHIFGGPASEKMEVVSFTFKLRVTVISLFLIIATEDCAKGAFPLGMWRLNTTITQGFVADGERM